jgi:hypothetical protein
MEGRGLWHLMTRQSAMGIMTGKPQGGRPEGRRKDELEDEGENTWQEVTGGNERKKGKGMGQDGTEWKRTVEGGGYWRWDIVGSTESHQFQTPPPLLKVEWQGGSRIQP